MNFQLSHLVILRETIQFSYFVGLSIFERS